MSDTITVTGGVGGITAQLDDLIGLAGLLQTAADSIGQAREDLSAPVLRWLLEACAGDDPVGIAEIMDDLSALTNAFGPLHLTEIELARSSFALRAAAAAYHQADTGIAGSILHAFGDLAIGASELVTGGYSAGARHLIAASGSLGGLLPPGWLEAALPMASIDGHAVLHDERHDPWYRAPLPPRTLTDLIDALATRNEGRAGDISVSFVVGADGARRAIVDIPGTKSWNPLPNHDVTSVGTDIRALSGRDTAYEEGVFQALAAAGVSASDEVMLVGHSEGGIVAVNAARDAARSGRFRITHVVTAGAPIGEVARQLPDSVQVLALENTADVVPKADSAANPDRPNITTVQVDEQHSDLGKNHDLDTSYLPAATAAEHSCSASVDAFLQSAQGFLSSPTMHTQAFRITREF